MVDCSVVTAYINFKVNNIVEYTNIILKCIYGKNYDPNKETIVQLKSCVSKHLSDFSNNVEFLELSRPDINEFYKIHNISDRSLQRVFYTMFNKIIDVNTIKNNEVLTNTCLILGNSILIAIELDSLTNSIVDDNLSYREAINEVKVKYSKILTDDVLKNMKWVVNLLSDPVNKNIKTNKMLVKEYTENDFKLEFLTINNVKDNEIMYETRVDIAIPSLADKGKKKKEKIIKESKLITSLTEFSIDKLGYFILNLSIKKRTIPIFIVDLPEDYLKTKKSIKLITSLLDCNVIKEHVFLRVSKKDFEKNFSNLEILKSNNIVMIINNFDMELASRKDLAIFSYMDINYIDKAMDSRVSLAEELKILPIMYNVNDDDIRKSCIEKNVWLIKNNKNMMMIPMEKVMGDDYE